MQPEATIQLGRSTATVSHAASPLPRWRQEFQQTSTAATQVSSLIGLATAAMQVSPSVESVTASVGIARRATPEADSVAIYSLTSASVPPSIKVGTPNVAGARSAILQTSLDEPHFFLISPVKKSVKREISPSFQQSSPFEIYGLAFEMPETRTASEIVAEIDRLKAGVEDEVTPTDYAYEQARRTVEAAYAAIKPRRHIPTTLMEPWATTDDVGGIRLLWDVGSRKLRANFGAGPGLRTYLYHESPSEHDAEPLNIRTLTGRLKWLTE